MLDVMVSQKQNKKKNTQQNRKTHIDINKSFFETVNNLFHFIQDTAGKSLCSVSVSLPALQNRTESVFSFITNHCVADPHVSPSALPFFKIQSCHGQLWVIDGTLN